MGSSVEAAHGSPRHVMKAKRRPANARRPLGDAKGGREREIKALLLLFKKNTYYALKTASLLG